MTQAQRAHDMTAEWELILRVLRARYGAPDLPRRIPAGLDGDRVLALASRDRVLPFVHDGLAPVRANLPPAAWQKLHDAHLGNAARNAELAEELARIVDLLAGRNARVLAFRGPVLAQALYGDLARRQFADLDILVRRFDVPRVTDLLVGEHYEPQFRLTRRQEGALLRFRSERLFIQQQRRLPLDVHWSVLPPGFAFAQDEESLWSRSRAVECADRELWTLSPEDLLLFLVAHGAKHAWDQLALVCDVAEFVVRRRDANWPEIVERARRAGKGTMLQVGLLLAQRLLGSPVPDEVRPGARATALAGEIAGRIERGGRDTVSRREKWSLPWRLLERAGDRRDYALDFLVPTGVECGMADLPEAAWFLYHPLRWGWLIARRVVGGRRDLQIASGGG